MVFERVCVGLKVSDVLERVSEVSGRYFIRFKGFDDMYAF